MSRGDKRRRRREKKSGKRGVVAFKGARGADLFITRSDTGLKCPAHNTLVTNIGVVTNKGGCALFPLPGGALESQPPLLPLPLPLCHLHSFPNRHPALSPCRQTSSLLRLLGRCKRARLHTSLLWWAVSCPTLLTKRTFGPCPLANKNRRCSTIGHRLGLWQCPPCGYKLWPQGPRCRHRHFQAIHTLLCQHAFVPLPFRLLCRRK